MYVSFGEKKNLKLIILLTMIGLLDRTFLHITVSLVLFRLDIWKKNQNSRMVPFPMKRLTYFMLFRINWALLQRENWQKRRQDNSKRFLIMLIWVLQLSTSIARSCTLMSTTQKLMAIKFLIY